MSNDSRCHEPGTPILGSPKVRNSATRYRLEKPTHTFFRTGLPHRQTFVSEGDHVCGTVCLLYGSNHALSRQFRAVYSASALAVQPHVSSPLASQWREKREAASRRTLFPPDELQPTPKSNILRKTRHRFTINFTKCSHKIGTIRDSGDGAICHYLPSRTSWGMFTDERNAMQPRHVP